MNLLVIFAQSFSNRPGSTDFSNHQSDKTFHEKLPNELKTAVEDPIKTVIKRKLDTVNENANIVRKRYNQSAFEIKIFTVKPHPNLESL